MAVTNFAALTTEQKLVWSREVWKDARDAAFMTRFIGTDSNSVIQRITELTKTEKGEQVIMHLVADLVSDGVVGDNEREGNEEEMKSYNDTITIDMITQSVRQKGKLAEQKTVINFRMLARDKLAYWLANRMDQLAILTLSGVSYTKTNGGAARIDSAFSTLAFASDVSAPTANRHYRVDNTDGTSTGYVGILPGNTAEVAATDVLTYSSIVDVVTLAKTNYIKPLMSGGKEFYVAFLRPEGLAQLKKDNDYQRAVVTGMERSKDNPFFTGGIVTVDGLVLHDHRLVYNVKDAQSGVDMWGAGSNVTGARMLVCGSQALGLADLGSPEWAEKLFNYKSSPGISIDKMFGLLKPKYHTIHSNTVEDFGVMAVDHAI